MSIRLYLLDQSYLRPSRRHLAHGALHTSATTGVEPWTYTSCGSDEAGAGDPHLLLPLSIPSIHSFFLPPIRFFLSISNNSDLAIFQVIFIYLLFIFSAFLIPTCPSASSHTHLHLKPSRSPQPQNCLGTINNPTLIPAMKLSDYRVW